MYEKIVVEKDSIDGRILWIKLNNPERLNVLGMEVMNELYNALLNADKDDDIHAIIITSTGSNFCAGADVKELIEMNFEKGVRWMEAFWRIMELIKGTGKPVIAAIKGVCVAGGHELAMMCDLVVAGKSLRLGQPEATVGATALGGAVQLLPLVVGEKRAREILFTGRILSASEAYQFGLVNRVVDDVDVENEARKLAIEIINGKSPQAFRVIKSGLKFWTDLAMLNWQLARDITSMVWLSEEFRERCRDFLEKKKMKPRKFTGIAP
ncbi:MAG: enoyl-CoA hydratase/isomerase family protein [Candidatus Methanomethylicia archaeon]